MKKNEAFERECGWFDEHGTYYYINKVMGVRIPEGMQVPKELLGKANGTEAMKKLIDKLLAEALEPEVEHVDEMTIKQIGEKTIRREKGEKQKFVPVGGTAFDPEMLKFVRRVFRDGRWFVDGSVLSSLYITLDDMAVAVLLPMRVKEEDE